MALDEQMLKVASMTYIKMGGQRKEEMILVEGYVDVIALHQAGVENVVASMGTSLTPGQRRLIKRYTDRVFIAYDQDKAGIAATLRGVDLLLGADLNIAIINMPQGVDPDELIKREGKDGFIRRKKRAISYFDYRLDMAISDRSSLESKDKIEIVTLLFSALEGIEDKMKLVPFMRRISQRLDLDEELLWEELSEFRQKKK